MGNLLFVKVHSATMHDTKSGIFPALYTYLLYKTIKGYSADGGYRRTFEDHVSSMLHLIVDISTKINWSRRLSKDYEIKTNSEETMVKISHIHTMFVNTRSKKTRWIYNNFGRLIRLKKLAKTERR